MKSSVIPFTAPGLPPPGGHYSHATIAGNMVFVSGQLGVKPDGSHTADQPFEVQARQTISNLMLILEAAGCKASDVAKVTVFIVGMEHWAKFNVIYAEFFGPSRPARSVVPVNPLHFGYLIEIEAVAYLPTVKD